MSKNFDFTTQHINTDFVASKNNEYNEFNNFDFAYEKPNKPNVLHVWYKKQNIATQITTRIIATMICATLLIGGAKAGIEVGDYLFDRADIGNSHYNNYNYLGRFNPINIEINRGRR